MNNFSSILISFPSGGELIIIVIAVLIFFGADKIPEFARMLGKGMKEFKKATDDIKREINVETKDLKEEIKKDQFDIKNKINEFKKELDVDDDSAQY